MLNRRRLIALAAASALAPSWLPRSARAQAWPTRFVRLIVPFPPGGGTDAIARIVAGKLSDLWGQQVVVENRGGGATNIGTEAVVRSEADGYTLLLTSMPLAVNRFLFPVLPYDPVGDLAPVSLICDYPNIMAVPITSPAHSVAEFIAYANANKGKVTFASSGHGTSVHLAGELFRRMARTEMLHIPYRGAGPALNDLIPGRVDVMFNNIGAVLPLIQGGKLRGLAVTTLKRAKSAARHADHRRGRRARVRRVVVVRDLRAGQDALGRGAKDQRRYRGRGRRCGDARAARATRRRAGRIVPVRTRRAPEVRDGQVGPGHQGGRDHRARVIRIINACG